MPGRKATSEQWSAEAKLATVIETAALSEAEPQLVLRGKSLHPDQVKQWKAKSLQGFQHSAEQVKAIRQQTRSDKLEIKQLRRGGGRAQGESAR